MAKPLIMPIIEWGEFIGRMEAAETVQIQALVGTHLGTAVFSGMLGVSIVGLLSPPASTSASGVLPNDPAKRQKWPLQM